MAKNIFLSAICALVWLAAGSAYATTYFVSTSGSDAADGSTELTAWATVNNGDRLGLINPGDTVKVLAGTYVLSNKIDLAINGTEAAPIVYCSEGGTVVLDDDNRTDIIFEVKGSHTVINGFELTNTRDNAIHLKGDSCTASYCYIHDTEKFGIRIEGVGCLALKNIITNTGDDGIRAEGSAKNTLIYGNTIYSCLKDGLEIKDITQRAFNNVLVENGEHGINGNANNICGFNDVWGNSSGNYNSAVDSAGGMSVDPLFVDPLSGDFTLQSGSPVIDKGLDLGYPYIGDAPDMGAKEFMPTSGRNFFVSETGDDDNDGLSISSAWATIDNGDIKGIVVAGDTVNILPGTYSVLTTVLLTASGLANTPIVYQHYGDGTAVVDMGGLANVIVQIDGDHTQFRGITLTNCARHGLSLNGDSCFIAECTIHDFGLQGIDVYGSYNLIQKNLIYNVGQSGLVNRAGAESNKFYGNTVYNYSMQGVYIDNAVSSCRIFNNIIANGNLLIDGSIAIYGSSGNVCAYNDIWNGLLDTDYSGGVHDSAGRMDVNPQFVDWAGDDFTLQPTSPVIDKGLNIGYPFSGLAPDMGYFETGNNLPELGEIDNQKTVENVDLYFHIKAGDIESTPTLSTSPLPTGASFADHGDGTGSFDWTPTFFQSGAYEITFYATDDSSAVDSETITITVADAGNQPPVLILPEDLTIAENVNGSFVLSASDIESMPVVTSSALPTGAGFTDNGDGSGSFTWTPTYLQSGVYEIWFYATDDSSAVDSGLFTITVNDAGNQQPVLAAIGDRTVTENANLNFDISATDIESIPSLTTSTLPSGAGFTDNGDGTGTFDWTPMYPSAGDYDIMVYASDDSLAIDSEQITITVNPAALVTLQIAPDSATITADSTLQYTISGFDSGGFGADPGNITWSVVDALGDIDNSGLFDPTTVGTTGVIAVSDKGAADTTACLEITPGLLHSLAISPDMTDTAPGDSVQFEATGYDSDGNTTTTGTLTWDVLGSMGTINADGTFIATKPGSGEITVISDINAVVDTSGSIDVEALVVYNIPLGNGEARSAQEDVPILAFRVENYFDDPKSLTGLTVRNNSHGPGTAEQVRSNMNQISLYADLDNDSLLSASDSLIGSAAITGEINHVNLGSLAIAPDSGITIIGAINISPSPRDGDSLDIYFTTTTDLDVSDATVPLGPETVNSFGYVIINGMIAAQIRIITSDVANAAARTFSCSVLSFDLPRNGYQTDTLKSLNIYNEGTATDNDIESFVLYKDNGNNVFTSTAEEYRLGQLVFTGDRWSISGLNVALTDAATRFYIGANIADYPANGATIALAIPTDGVQMSSGNDGPIDMATVPVDTVTILSSESVDCTPIAITPRDVTPGESTGPVMAVEMINGYAVTAYLDSLYFSLEATDPDDATLAQLDSQIDSVQLYLTSDDNIIIDANDSLLASSQITDGSGKFLLNNLPIDGFGGGARLVPVPWLNLYNAKDGNTINFSVASDDDIYFSAPVTISGTFPLTNPGVFTISAFPAAAVNVFDIDQGAYYGGQTNRPIFNFDLPSNGYSSDILSGLTLTNLGSLNNASDIVTLKLWADPDGDITPDAGDYIGQMTYRDDSWSLTGMDFAIKSGGSRFVVTANIANRSFDAGSIQLSLPTGGVNFKSGTDGPDDISVDDTRAHLVFPSNRITAISIPAATATVAPGSSQNNLMIFALYNGYIDQAKTLTGLNLTDISVTTSDLDFADYELGQVSLYYDQDGDRILNDDSLIATGNFTSGALHLSGLDIELPAEELTYFFVTADIPLNVIDSDSLAVEITGPSDFNFIETVNLNGDLPLVSGGHLVIDGSIAAQYDIVPVTPRTVSPSDTSIVIMAFKPAIDGDQTDTLKSLTIQNAETADDGDLETVELWLDTDGDEKWQDTDQYLGTFSYSGGEWTLDNIDLEFGDDPQALFVIADIAAAATPGATFRGRIPISGFEYFSANDGPRDKNIVIGATFTISTSALRISYNPLGPNFSIGQNITVEIATDNLLATDLDNVIGELVSISDSDLVTVDSSASGPVTIPAQGSTIFKFYLTAVAAGELTFDLRAAAPPTGDTSAVVTTENITIQTVPSDALVKLINTIPTSVTRGQFNVFPLSLSVSHSDPEATSAAYLMQGLTLTCTR